jgi:predicted Co/Zn/Cd cation transporter (cation efflux family)
MRGQNSRSEHRVLLTSASGNLIIGVVGIIFAVISSSQVIMLDGLFNFTYFVTGLFTLKVARMVFTSDPAWGEPSGKKAAENFS